MVLVHDDEILDSASSKAYKSHIVIAILVLYICKQKYDSYYTLAIKEKYPRLHSTEEQFWVGVTMVTWKSVTL